MAVSPSHKLGQIIGEQFEAAVKSLLSDIADEYCLYLDYQHARPARGGKKKVGWTDLRGNTHYLDYVIEDGGSEYVQGKPRAFIEIAWRRYTKHSKNKAQEIQAALTPLFERYRGTHPFLGVILAGEFTGPSLEQFKSNRFNVLHCPYETIVSAFSGQVDIRYGEDTSDDEMLRKVEMFEQLSEGERQRIAGNLRRAVNVESDEFAARLREALTRRVEFVYVLPLAGAMTQFSSIEEAKRYISEYQQSSLVDSFVRYEVNVRYTNGDDIRGAFQDKNGAISFLESFEVS